MIFMCDPIRKETHTCAFNILKTGGLPLHPSNDLTALRREELNLSGALCLP
jgi:hypothetical protein